MAFVQPHCIKNLSYLITQMFSAFGNSDTDKNIDKKESTSILVHPWGKNGNVLFISLVIEPETRKDTQGGSEEGRLFSQANFFKMYKDIQNSLETQSIL